MNTNYKLKIPRKTYNGLCAFMQHWGDVYRVPGAVVLRSMLRSKQKAGRATAVASNISAPKLAAHFTNTLHGLGRARVRKNDAILDLRDLMEHEIRSMIFVASTAKLQAQQIKCLERITTEVKTFNELPEMVRIALSAVD